MLSHYRSLASLLTLALFPALAQAQNCRIDRFSSSISSQGNLFGEDIDVSGDRMIIGAPLDVVVNEDGVTYGTGGAAHAYRKVAGEWVQDGVLFPSAPPISVSQHARVVAIDGDRAAAAGQGATFIYTYDSEPEGWVARPPLLVTDYTGLAEIRDLDLQGDRLFVGFRVLTNSIVQVLVDEYQDVAGTWTLVQRVFAAPEGLGFTVGGLASPGEIEIVGDRMFVGLPGDTVGGQIAAGSVTVFERSQGIWLESAVLTAAAPLASGRLGASLDADADGESVVAGHRSEAGGAGLATLFTRQAGAWSRVVELPGPGDQGLGFDDLEVALGGDRIAVGDPDGAPGSLFTTEMRGIVGIHKLEAGVWSPAGKLRAIGSANNARFGAKLVMGPDRELLIAHPEQISLANVRGIVDAFSLNGTGCADFLVSPKVESVNDSVFTEMALLGTKDPMGLGYVVLMSPTAGGMTTIDGVDLPLTADAFTTVSLTGGAPFLALVGVLGQTGKSEAPGLRFPSLPAATAGLELQLSWASFGFATQPFGIQSASELRTIQITP